ncbi:sigma-70 family RNA polymerase sigma factor [Streptomyces sp. NPDC017673]|uniref:sigma-70 family RNA polymerase sigma factor n=1 Tax=unclassified Streptomyces TaxID=2593676 RepID=UPI00379060F8
MTTSAHHRPPPAVRHHARAEALVAEHRATLVARAETWVGDHHAAEDIAQETLVRAWQHIGRLPTGRRAVRGRLLRTARGLAVEGWPGPFTRHEIVTAESGDVPEADRAETVLASVVAHALLRTLTHEHREVLVHTCVYGFTVRETAQRLGVPAGTVVSRRSDALRTLRQQDGSHALLEGLWRLLEPAVGPGGGT